MGNFPLDDYFLGSDGRISTRLGSARESISKRFTTTVATSSGRSFQVVAGSRSLLRPKLVLTEPGITQLTRIWSYRTSCISASENPRSPNFDAQYAAIPGIGFLPARLPTLM